VELEPVGTLGSWRIRVRLALERATPAELEECLRHAMIKAGALKFLGVGGEHLEPVEDVPGD
jgi:hypothetical protein